MDQEETRERQDEDRGVREDVAPRRADYAPEGVKRETGSGPILKRTVAEYREDNMMDWAAALTYYGLLSLFPALIALVSLVGLFGDPQSITDQVTQIVSDIGPSSAADTFSGPIESITQNRGASGVLFVVGLLVALWSASGYVGAFSRASNIAWETPEGRSFFKLRPLQILVTVVMVITLAVVAVALILTGPIVQAVGDAVGLGDTAITVWEVAKWPVLLAVMVLMFSVLYYAAPNVNQPGFKWITPGSLFAVLVWIIVSAAFAFYVANFGSYDKTYGTLGGLVSLLVWMWITNLALLFGVELNSERERDRELRADVPRAEREIQLEPRDEPDYKQTT
jgi:membrane protein